MKINRPVRFSGTREQADRNYHTHEFDWSLGGDARCMNCDCRPSNVAADYPCGQEPPREVVIIEYGKPATVRPLP